jgi:hypothetical protein
MIHGDHALHKNWEPAMSGLLAVFEDTNSNPARKPGIGLLI